VAKRQKSYAELNEHELAQAMQFRLLAATDWIEDCELAIDKSAWFDYRQSLRAISNQAGWPHNIDWPKPPRG
jgi:hypothetical protein